MRGSCGMEPMHVTVCRVFSQANPTCTASVCDVSPTAIANLQTTLQNEGIDSERVHVAVHDAASPAGCPLICRRPADICMLIFTLSAVPPDHMHTMLETALQCLRPGGLLLVRDYGCYDMVQLRFPAAQRIDDGLYYRYAHADYDAATSSCFHVVVS